MTKSVSSILVICLLLACSQPAVAQYSYKAKAIFKDGGATYQTPVLISLNSESLEISGQKDDRLRKTFLYSAIVKSEYSYTDKPQIAKGLGVATVYALIDTPLITVAVLGILFAFTKKKSHWLVLNTENAAFLFELNQESYRQLIFEMHSKGINVEDLGDRDYKAPKTKQNKKTGSK